MANYQELLSKAVGALPENNGASRREVYEKARKALVTQLRAINPPLPAREITQHRLELEDCIREVEHDATEELLGGLRETENVSIEPIVETPTVETPVEPVAAEAPSDDGLAEKEIAENAPIEEKLKSENVNPDDGKKEEKAKPVPDQAVAPEQKSAEEKPEKTAELESEEAKEDKTPAESDKKSNQKPVEKPAEKTDDKPDDVNKVDQNKTADDEIGKPKDETREAATPSKDDDAALDVIIAEAEKGKNADVPDAPKIEPSFEPKVDPKPEAKPKSLSAKLTTESDKGVGAAMSRVREVDNVSTAALASAKESISPRGEKVTFPLESAGIVGAGNLGSALGETKLDNAKVAASSKLRRSTDKVSQVAEEAGGDAQSAVDRAIETLDREARGAKSTPENEPTDAQVGFGADVAIAEPVTEEKSSNGLTIFLVLVILLLGAVGGGGYWAWKEGFIDLDSLFASGEVVEEVQATDPSGDEGQPIRQVGTNDETSGPGNTTTEVEPDAGVDPNVALEDPNKTNERLDGVTNEASQTDAEINQDSQTDPAQSDAGDVAQPNEDDKVEDRLGADDANSDPALVQEGDPDAVATNVAAQSLLLEAAPDGGSGAVPFSGTVEWSRGLDELGEPTLIGQANIPARNMNVKVLIRRNGDVSLPASHLMEIDFDVSETFAGGAVAGLPGILLKNEELVQGAALVGASARVVGNSFLFALSAAEQDIRINLDLLENRKWMDLALIYSSGRRAIITLEKDDAAQTLFSEVMTKWAEASGGGVGEAVDSAVDAVADGVTNVVEGAVSAQ